jgi:hypothetical protein
MMYQENPRGDKQNSFAIDHQIPFVIYLGEDEIKANKIKIKVKYI